MGYTFAEKWQLMSTRDKGNYVKEEEKEKKKTDMVPCRQTEVIINVQV